MTGYFALSFHAGLAAAAFVVGLPSAASPAQKSPIECTLLLDQQSGDAILRKGTCDQRFSPMSTFKVALAVMGYDAGILTDEHTPALDYKPEYRAPDFARKRTDPTIWLKDSIVWYSQQLTQKLGTAAFADYVQKFNYGDRDVSDIPGGEDGLTHAWLMSSLKISPVEQADFIRRLRLRELPVSEKAYDMTFRIMPTFVAGDWMVQGKTGSGYLRDARGHIDRSQPLAWFVGWAENGGRKIIFTRMRIGRQKSKQPPSMVLRAEFLKQLPELMRGGK